MLSRFSKPDFLFSLVLVMGSINSVQGAQSPVPTPLELISLPKYCQARWSNNPQIVNAWAQRMGSCSGNIHHYCFALNWIKRAKTIIGNRENKVYALNQARSELDYTLNHWPESCALRAEAQIHKQTVRMMFDHP